ncbi:MAG TPA: RNA polymerase sigma-I factor [Clostridiaceae bacterium]|nr:RNA polymerase sigma-I factor [Clostridiaceae bacterium]
MDRHFMKNILFSGALNKRVLKIQNNQEEIDPLIREYKPFIMATLRNCTQKSYITEQDDEYSIALIAFTEAVKAYRNDKGNFLSFAKQIIKMRCIDYYRKEKRHSYDLPFLDNTNEENAENNIIYLQSLKNFAQDELAHNRALEIEQLKQELADWNISFPDLVNVSPKQAKTRQMCKKVIDYLMKDEDKLQYIFRKKMIPLSDIEKDTLIPRKQLERVRKYIIAVLIIKKGDYPFLNDYVRDWGCDK